MKKYLDKLFKKKNKEVEVITDDNFDDLDNIDLTELEEPTTTEDTTELLQDLEEEAEREAEKVVKQKNKKSLKLDSATQLFAANAFLICAIVFSYYIFSGQTISTLKNIEVYKNDLQKVERDNRIVTNNLLLLEEERSQALEYRKLNYFLEQAVPTSEKYEDNLIVILQILDDSINVFSRNQKYLESLSLRPDTQIRDVEVFNTDTERILAVSYNLSVAWFTRYKDIQDFVELITGRLRIFHINNMSISKVLDQRTNRVEYKLSIQMYSYYRLPKVDEFWNIIELETDSTF